ncbi:MAG TPA: trehalase family glycosidase [Candidatus Bathyarchaeia archaeon]|nr:trehalase family glycosidase [Candidatus Bathyarchaeia archaeon]
MARLKNMNLDRLLEDAKKVLEGNWNGNFTIPAATLYPHQWSWDAAFIAIGESYFNIDMAIKELEFLFDAQWQNGMVPHIVFNEKEKTYFPAADFYDITRSPYAPKHIGTSGMTQPPVHAISCYYIYENAEDKMKAKEFLSRIYPKLKHFHRFLLTDRDPEKSGLVTIFHPWESGLDDSPVWDEALSKIRIQHTLKFERLDVIAVGGAKETIPSDDMYNKFIYMIELMKQYNYDQQKMYETFPFKIKALVFSSILHVANKYMIKIADILGEDTQEIKEWKSRTETNFYKYFHPDISQNLGNAEELLFCNYDLVSLDWIRKRTIASIVPIYTGLIPRDQIDLFVKWITHAPWCEEGKCHTPALPSTELDEPYFKHLTYWRGPVWVNVNWLIWLGLLKYGYNDIAERIRQGIFELAANHGFREYYDPFTGRGLGGKSFSWTAALVIDMIKDRGIGVPPD